MKTNLTYKTIFIVAVVLACIIGVIGFPTSIAKARETAAQRIHLGLDLKGGTHLILQVHVEEAVGVETDQTIDRLKELLKQRNISYDEITRGNDVQHILVRGIPNDRTSDFRDLATERYGAEWDLSSSGSGEYLLRMKAPAVSMIQDDALKQARETISRRVDELGLTEPVVQEYGRGQYMVMVQLPGVDDPGRVKDIMQTTAMLEIREVKDPQSYPSPEAALAAHGGVLPEGTEILRSVERRGETSEAQPETWYIVNRSAVVTGRDLRTARVGRDENNRPEVDFSLKADGAARFARYTESNVGNQMAVVLDRKIQTAATIQSRISDQGRITGSFTPERASDLALVLKAGALPASITYMEERTVGASLGADSIRKGFLSGVVGLSAVVIFMLFYYKRSGLNAVLALALNLVVVLACLAYFGAVLTLPGIAGLILLIGMAVDSNVLIFERIREELRAGKSVTAAVKAGFEKAFTTIIDTHVCTIVACMFLFLFGTGPVRGFAVTLVVGLIANVFTAVFVSRTIFDWEFSGRSEPKISI